MSVSPVLLIFNLPTIEAALEFSAIFTTVSSNIGAISATLIIFIVTNCETLAFASLTLSKIEYETLPDS